MYIKVNKYLHKGNKRFLLSSQIQGMLCIVLFLQGFDQLRVEGLLCDVTLVPGDGDEVFPVHRAMMASASDYFKAMFTGGVFIKAVSVSKLLLQIALIQTLRHKFSAEFTDFFVNRFKFTDLFCESVQNCKQHCGLNISLYYCIWGFKIKF